ncbi:MAG TPA: hypothetical protein VG841_13960 [Caulobacterales bacterium]|nr:hypothetical protein [Caulobacterales bacterium]
MRALLSLAAVLALASCSPPPATPTTSATGAANFVIDDLAENDGDIQGCARMLGRVNAQPGADVFREDGVDTGAKGFIRIDGVLIQVNLVSANATEQGGARAFADASRSTQVVETLTTGAAHEESDSVEESGALTVTHNGATQILQVSGGTAC